MMFQQVTIPVSGGLGEMTSRLVRPANGGPLDVAENCTHTRLGTLAKRYGFTQLATDTTSGTIRGARLLCSAGDTLTLVDERRAWRWSPQLGEWQDRGPVAPGGLRYGEQLSGSRSYDDADAASNESYTIIVAGAQFSEYAVNVATAPDTITNTVYDVARVMVVDASGVVVLPPTDMLISNNDVTRRRSFRCATTGTKLLMCAQVSISAGARSIEVREWLPATPHTLPAVGQIITNTYPGSRAYDAIRVEGGTGNAGDYLFAHIDFTTQDVVITRYSSGHVAGVTTTITETAEGVALYEASNGDVYVAVMTRTAVNLYRRNGDLTASWGPVTQYTFTTDADGDTEVGDTPGVVTDGTSVATTFNVTTAGVEKTRLRHAYARASDGLVVNSAEAVNCAVFTRPWLHDGRFYVGGTTFTNRYPYDCGCVWELYCATDNPLTGDIQPTVAAAYHMGTADRPRGIMSAGNVFTVGDRVTWLGFRYTSATAEVSASPVRVGEPRTTSLVGVELVTLDYSAPITAAQTATDELVVGGSLVTFLGSSVTQELGWLVPPCIRNEGAFSSGIVENEADDAAATGPIVPGLAAGTEYIWTAVWLWVDADGVMHRSAPAPPQAFTPSAPTAGKARYVELWAKTTGASNRLNISDASCRWYRADAQVVFRELALPTQAVTAQPLYTPNIDTDYETAPVLDIGVDNADRAPLYTTGGVLENVAPAGSDVAALVGRRLWLGSARQVQYSKPLEPPAVGAQRVAPEFNEGFALQLPGGQLCTGIAELDGRAIVFTSREVFVVLGQGPNDIGQGGSFELQKTSADEGCKDPRSVAAYPEGVFYQGARGIYELTRSLQVQFVGAPVVDQTDAFPVVTSAVVVASANEVRFTVTNVGATDGRVLVYNYLAKAWHVWKLRRAPVFPLTTVPVSACVHDGDYYVLDANGGVWLYDESTHLDDGSLWVALRVRTSPLQAAGVNAWQRVGRVSLLGQRHTACDITLRLYHDFATSSTHSYTWGEVELDAAFEATTRAQVEALNPRQECAALAVEVEDVEPDTPGTGQGLELAGFALELGVERGPALLPAGVR